MEKKKKKGGGGMELQQLRSVVDPLVVGSSRWELRVFVLISKQTSFHILHSWQWTSDCLEVVMSRKD